LIGSDDLNELMSRKATIQSQSTHFQVPIKRCSLQDYVGAMLAVLPNVATLKQLNTKSNEKS
jgi:hypothetical protein